MVHFTFAYRQFEFVNDSSDMEMGIGGQITALLKLEYPSIIEESPTKKYYAKKLITILSKIKMGWQLLIVSKKSFG